MTTLKLMMQATLVATLMYGSGVLAQTKEPDQKAPEAPAAEQPAAPAATDAAAPQDKATEEPAATAQPAAPDDKAMEPAEATAPAEPAAAAAEPTSPADVKPSQLAAAEAELSRVQATKTKKDKWDVCEETSHWSPKDGENDAYKAQLDCMGAGGK